MFVFNQSFSEMDNRKTIWLLPDTNSFSYDFRRENVILSKRELNESEVQRLQPSLIYYGRGVVGMGDTGMLGGGEWGIEVMGCLGSCRRGRQWWRERRRNRWRDGEGQREGFGHLSSGESTVWPGRESGPLADKTHARAHTDAHINTLHVLYAYRHTGYCALTHKHVQIRIHVRTHRCVHTSVTLTGCVCTHLQIYFMCVLDWKHVQPCCTT